MNILIGAFTHEVNFRNPITINLNDIESNGLYFENDIIKKFENTKSEIGGFLKVLKKSSINILPSVANTLIIGGKLKTTAFNYIKNEIIKRIKKAINLDGILFCFHGNMVTEDSDDAEGDFLEEIRNIVGEQVIIVGTFDMHATITEKVVKNIDVVVGYDTAPHIDMFETGKKAAEILISIIENKTKIYKEFKKIPILIQTDNFLTDKEPALTLMNKVKQSRLKNEIINISVFSSYSLMDVKEAGPSVVVTSTDKNIANKVALELAQAIWDLRKQFLVKLTSIEEAIQKAREIQGGPIIFVDQADNTTAGGHGDNTNILKEIIQKGVENVAFGIIRDPFVVAQSIKSGIGKKITVKIGAKYDKKNSSPITINGFIKLISDGNYIYKAGLWNNTEANMGKTVLLKIDNDVELVVTEKPAYAFDPELFKSVGIDPLSKKILVLKCGTHFRAAYEPIAKDIFLIDCLGVSDVNFSRVHYKKIPQQIYPLDMELKYL